MNFMLGLSVAAASGNSVFLHKAHLLKKDDVFLFSLIGSIVWSLMLFIINGFSISITPTAVFWGVLYGITQAAFLYFKTAAMNSGPVSIVTLIGNCSLLVSVLFCFLVWQEPIFLSDVVGIAILMIAVILCTYKKQEAVFEKRRIGNVILFFILASGVGIVLKAFSKYGEGAKSSDMIMISGVTMILCYTILCALTGSFKRKNKERKKGFCLYALGSGALSCSYNSLNAVLSGALPGAVFFPVFNGGVILLSAVLSAVFCREKITLKTTVGLVTGIIGIVIIGVL